MGNCFLYKRGFGGASGGPGGGGSTPEVEKTASGKVILLTDSAEKPLKGLRLFGKTTQNGTPSPDAPVPMESVGDGGSIVVSVAGKNLLNSTKFSWRTALPTKIDTQFLTCQLPAGEYVLSIKSNTGIMRINVIAVNLVDAEYKTVKSINGGSKNGINGSSVFSLTEEEAAKGTRISFYYNYPGDSGYTTGEYVTELQIEPGSSATAYEPYKEPRPTTLPTPNGLPGIHVSEGGNYTDENGWQWICDEVDFAGGKYIQRVNSITHDGTEAGLQYDSSYNSYVLPVPNMMLDDNNVMCISSHAEGRAYNSRTNSKPNIYADEKVIGLSRVFIRGTGITGIDAWKAFLAQEKANGDPFKIIYILETPIETPLTSQELAQYAALRTLTPSTTLYNDADSYMEVKYMAKGG